MVLRMKFQSYTVLIGLALIGLVLSIPAPLTEVLSGEGRASAPFVAEYDPLEEAERTIDENANPWAGVPSACYVKTDGAANSCWTCHSGAVAPNTLADWDL